MKSPFKFLDSFTKEDREIFFGREKEIEELYQRIFKSKIMLVYGVSGTGKSSLINCGLANKFHDEDWLPLNIRRGKNILESMYAAILAASLTPKSQYSSSEIQFRKYTKSLYLDHYKPIYFIFDQFEELFIFGTKEEKSLFVRVIKTLIDSDILCRFIFVMREEYMANVTEFEKHIPVFFSNRVRIENMDINNAIQAIKGPCKVSDISVEDGFPEALIENLSPGSPDIELTYLQVFLDKIYRLGVEEVETGKGDDKNITFTLDQLHKVGNVSDLLGTFLNDQISLLDDPDASLAVLKSFVSIKGTKRQMNLDEVKEYSQTLGKPISESVILTMLQNFVNLRILRDKDQHDRYELRHDSLATKIYEKISGVEKDILEIRQFIEDGYHNWQKRGILLSSGDLEYIGPYESRLFLSSELLNLITQSKNELGKVKSKRIAIFVASTLVLLIVFAGFTLWALIERQKTKEQEIIVKASYYNSLSKEFVNSDPTKAFRIADYSYRLNPSKSNFQNLVDIYSNNDFYFTYLPTKSMFVAWFKVLSLSGNIAVATNNRLMFYSRNGQKIKETNIELPANYKFDVSENGENYIIYSYSDQTLNVYDIMGNRQSRTIIKDALYETFFLPDSKQIFVVSIATNRLKLTNYSLKGDIISTIEEPLPPVGGSFIKGNSSDTIYYILGNGELNGWVPGNNKINKTKLKNIVSENTNFAQFIDLNRIAVITTSDSLKIYDLKGNVKGSWSAGVKENTGFGDYQPVFLKEQNLLCLRNEKGMKLWTLTGQNVSTIKLGSQAEGTQYFNKAKELLFIYNNSLIGYLPDRQRNDLILEKQNPKVRFSVYSNKIIESNNNEEFLIEFENGKLKKNKVIYSNDKIYLKVPRTTNVLTHLSENFKLPKKPDVTVFDILTGNPLVHLKDTIEMPQRITFSEDGNLIATYNKLLSNGDNNSTTYFTLFNSKGVKLRRFSITSFCERIKFSSDNSKILSTDWKTAILWDTSGIQLFKYIGHSAWIYDVDISYDNKYVLTSSIDKTVRLWSVNGKPLKVIDTETDLSSVSFFHDGSMFQIADKNYVKIYDINGILIQKVPTNRSNLAIYLPEDRSIIYTDNNGIYRTVLKEPVDSFLLTNNNQDLSLADKIEYNILSMNDLLESKKPYEIFTASTYYIKKVNKTIDVEEKKNAIKTAEQLLNKGLEFDTLHGAIARRLTQMYIQEKQFIEGNVNVLVEKCFNIISESTGSEELINTISFYGTGLDTTRNIYKFPEKALSLSEKVLNLYPNEKGPRERVSMLCSNLSFGLFNFSNQYQNAMKAVKIAIKADTTNQYSYTNLPLAYLFNNMYPEAEKEYLKWKDIPWTATKDFKTFRDAFLADFEDLEGRGITHPDFVKIKELLKK